MTLHTLYRFYDVAGGLLYVGITNNPPRRFEKHRYKKDWWHDVARIEIEHHPSREALRAAERHAIENESPLHNIRMNGSAVRERRIEWECDICGCSIADGDGYLTVSYGELDAYRQAGDAWNKRIEETYPGPLRCFPFTEFSDFPERVQWRVLHRDCDPNPETYDYWFGIERVRTQGEVLDISAHLLEKSWIKDTTWASIMRKAAR